MGSDLKEAYERYLAEEAAIRIPNVNVADRGWFHLCVLQAAIAWSRHPRANFRIGRGRHLFALHFEGPVEGKPVTMFSFRSAVETGEYQFTSLNPAKLPQGLTPAAKAGLARLRDLYEAALPQARVIDGTVTVAIRKHPQIDFLPIVDEARRVLDDGNQEFAPVDLAHISLPTEKAELFVGRTTITPSPKRRIRHVPPPVVVPQPVFTEESEDSDRGNFLAAQSHRKDEVASGQARAGQKKKSATRGSATRPKGKGSAHKPKTAAKTPPRAAKTGAARSKPARATKPARKNGRGKQAVAGRRKRRAG